MPVLFQKGEEEQQKANIIFGPFCLNIKICEKLNMSSPKPNFVDVNNQVGRKSIIWQYLWQDKNIIVYKLARIFF